MPSDNEYNRLRVLRNQWTRNNRMRARVQVGALALRYRGLKNAMVAGSIDKSAFQRAYAMTSGALATYRSEWNSRQDDINSMWNLEVGLYNSSENFMAGDLAAVESIYEQTLASLGDRYGKRIAYI